MLLAAQALGPAFEPYAEAMYERCMRIVAMQLQAREAAAAGQAVLIEPEREFIICALDLVSGLAEGLGPSLEALVGRSLLRQLLLQCCQDPSADVRQSAFALVGDLSKARLAPSVAPPVHAQCSISKRAHQPCLTACSADLTATCAARAAGWPARPCRHRTKGPGWAQALS